MEGIGISYHRRIAAQLESLRDQLPGDVAVQLQLDYQHASGSAKEEFVSALIQALVIERHLRRETMPK